MGTLILQNPRNVLAPLAMSLINSAIALYTSIVQNNSTGRLLKNLEWLLRLRHRASARMAATTGGDDAVQIDDDEEEDVELLGWRTRLVSRLGKGAQTAITITPTQSTTTPSPNTTMARTIHQALQKQFGPDDQHNITQAAVTSQPRTATDQATDVLVSFVSPQRIEFGDDVTQLHQFWDPMMLQDQLGSSGDPFSVRLGDSADHTL